MRTYRHMLCEDIKLAAFCPIHGAKKLQQDEHVYLREVQAL